MMNTIRPTTLLCALALFGATACNVGDGGNEFFSTTATGTSVSDTADTAADSAADSLGSTGDEATTADGDDDVSSGPGDTTAGDGDGSTGDGDGSSSTGDGDGSGSTGDGDGDGSTSSTGGGGGSCDADPADGTCTACVKTSCCDDFIDCSGDAECECLLLCMDDDGADFMECYFDCNASPGGPVSAIGTCTHEDQVCTPSCD